MKQQVKRHFNHFAKLDEKFKKKNHYYYDYIKHFLDQYVPNGSRVVDVGCGTGELLYHTEPAYGLGIDISERMVQYAVKKFPHLQFRVMDVEQVQSGETFDHVLMIDVIDHLQDIWDVLNGVENLVHEGTVICITTLNPLWQPIFHIAEALKLKMPEGPHNFVQMEDVINLLEIFDYTIVKKQMQFLVPKKIPILSEFLNRIAPHIPGLNRLCSLQTIVARKGLTSPEREYTCSVVVPCHNEEGNVEACAQTIPQMGKGTEVIFVNDGSTDGTLDKITELANQYPHVRVVSYPVNQGKGYAVRKGFEQANGDILMIFDADLTVPPEDLHEFYYPFAHEKAQFVNGSRLVYPLEDDAMRAVNLWGNQFFGMLVSWLIGQRLTDTLCGTKAFFRKDYERMSFRLDKWGDFDYLFATRDLNLKLVEIPIHYKRRQAGASKMRTFQHGLLLAKVCFWGFLQITLKGFIRKFFPAKEERTASQVSH